MQVRGWRQSSRRVEAACSRGGTAAPIESRTTAGGTRWRVKWRTGGTRDGTWDRETFGYLAEAKRFKALVDDNGYQRPTPEQLAGHGFAEILPAGVAAAPAPGPAQAVLTFGAYAEE